MPSLRAANGLPTALDACISLAFGGQQSSRGTPDAEDSSGDYKRQLI